MSSSIIVTRLLRLLTAEGESSQSPEDPRNAEKVPFGRAVAEKGANGSSNRTIPVANATKKAIVLLHVDETPLTPQSQGGAGTTWFEVMTEQVLPKFELPAAAANAIAVTGVTNYPKYRIWILPDNLNSDFAVPSIEDGEVVNIGSFPICSVKDVLLAESLTTGALIRVDFENRLRRTGVYVTNVINNKEEFGRAIFNELGGIISPSDASAPCRSSRPSVSHPSGDAVATRGSKVALSNAYKALAKKAGKDVKTAKYIYDKLYAGLGDKKVSIGILANAYEESTFDANIVSGKNIESSLGLWQMNVGSRGSIGVPKASITQRARLDNLTGSIQIPTGSSVLVYYAGGVLATNKGATIVTAADYTDQDLSSIYETVADADTQIEFVINTAKSMLASIEYKAADITAGQWAQWWQIYFEQPGHIESRVAAADNLTVELGVTV
tara:strand:+ start:71 stop:1390 length:1320 start_codon:yes stop_codon:yes gene_type:complete